MARRLQSRRAGRAVALAGLLVVPLSNVAFSGSSVARTNGQDAARALGQLFAATCLRHAGDSNGLRAALVAAHDHRLIDRPGHAILPRPGQAFEVPASPGHLMVLSFDDGWCGNGGTGIDPGTLTNSLSDAATSAGGTMKMMGAATDGREQRYLIERLHHKPLALLVLLRPTDTDAGLSGPALVQASLFASEMEGAPP